MSKKIIFIIIAIVVVLGGVAGYFLLVKKPNQELKETQSKITEPQYLIFQLFTFTPTPEGKAQPFEKDNIAKTVDEITNEVGGLKGDGKTRQLGFAVGPLALDHTDQELRQTIRESFEIAQEKNVAVAFHIDDSMFWLRRKDLWQDKNNVEWTDWNGTIHPHRWVGWAPTRLAPQMCYESPTLRKEISRIAKDVIGTEVKKGIDNLKVQNKEHLFAGVIAGWETHLADFRYIGPDDEDVKRAYGRQELLPRKRIGYCALSNLGFSAKNPPKYFDAELERVVQGWAEFWAKSLYEAEISKERIYTHFAFPIVPAEKENEILSRFRKPGFEPTLSGLSNHAFARTAFNQYSRPGFSTYPVGFKTQDKDALLAIVVDELKKQGNPPWTSAEGTNASVEGGAGGLAWTEYLAGMFNNGAAIVTIFAWEDRAGPYGKATRSAEAVAAYKKFLKGEELVAEKSESAISQPPTSASLPDKLQKIQKELPLWIQKNPSRQAEAESLLKKLDEYVKANNTAQAEKVADEILKLIEK